MSREAVDRTLGATDPSRLGREDLAKVMDRRYTTPKNPALESLVWVLRGTLPWATGAQDGGALGKGRRMWTQLGDEPSLWELALDLMDDGMSRTKAITTAKATYPDSPKGPHSPEDRLPRQALHLRRLPVQVTYEGGPVVGPHQPGSLEEAMYGRRELVDGR